MEYTAVVIATPIASERIAKTVKSGVAPEPQGKPDVVDHAVA
jgi:hypothetical protein